MLDTMSFRSTGTWLRVVATGCIVLLSAVVAAGCCSTPSDPEDPGSSKPARAAEVLFAAIRAGDDDAVWAMAAPITQSGRTLAELSARLDASAALREHETVRWTRVHYIGTDPDAGWAQRCVQGMGDYAELEATLVGPADTGTTVALNGFHTGGAWVWKDLELDGRSVLGVRAADQASPAPDADKAPPSAADPAPTPSHDQPPPVAKPVTRPKVALQGQWPVSEYRVDLQPPEGAWLMKYDATFGLDLAFGDRSRFGGPRSTISLKTTCEGACEPDSQAELIRTEGAERMLEVTQGRAAKVQWVVKPRQIGGRWLMHARALDSEGKSVAERVEIAHPQPEGSHAWLMCVVSVVGDELDRIDELTAWCQGIEARHLGESAASPEARFGERYVLGNQTVEFPTPAGFRFTTYDPVFERLVFQGESSLLDTISLGRTCYGQCSADRIEANLRAAAQKRVSRLVERDSDPIEDVPLESTGPGRFRQRISATSKVFERPSVTVHVSVIPPGSDRAFTCEANLYGDRVSTADTAEATCVRALSGL